MNAHSRLSSGGPGFNNEGNCDQKRYLVRLRRAFHSESKLSESSLELIPGESSSERLNAYRRPNRAVFVNSTVDAGRTRAQTLLGLTQSGLQR
jgi:hypothetical protein